MYCAKGKPYTTHTPLTPRYPGGHRVLSQRSALWQCGGLPCLVGIEIHTLVAHLLEQGCPYWQKTLESTVSYGMRTSSRETAIPHIGQGLVQCCEKRQITEHVLTGGKPPQFYSVMTIAERQIITAPFADIPRNSVKRGWIDISLLFTGEVRRGNTIFFFRKTII